MAEQYLLLTLQYQVQHLAMTALHHLSRSGALKPDEWDTVESLERPCEASGAVQLLQGFDLVNCGLPLLSELKTPRFGTAHPLCAQ